MSKKPTKPASSTASALYAYGLDEHGKPRGARFTEARDDIAKAALSLGCRIVTEATPVFAGLAVKLPQGRIYSSGKAFVPNIRRDLYDKLVEAGASISTGQPPANLSDSAAADSTPTKETTSSKETRCISPITSGLPRDWESIGVGHMVLIAEGPEIGWWEAVVLAREDDILTLRFRDYPKQPTFQRHLMTVALVNPGPA